MQFDKDQFKTAVDAVTPYAAKTSPLQILQFVKMESDGKTVTMTASRADAQIQYQFENPGEKFSFCIDAGALRRFAQFCADDVFMVVKEKRVTLNFGDTTTRLNVLPGNEFPVMERAQNALTEMDWAPLAEKIAAVEPFCMPNASMPQTSCVQIRSTGTALEVFAMTQANLVFESVPHIAPEFGLCIPRETARQMVGDFKSMTIRDEQIELRGDNAIALFRVSPHKPVNARAVIDRPLPNAGTIKRESMLGAINFAASFSDAGKVRPVIKIEAGDDDKAIRLVGLQNEAAAPFDYAGDPFTVGAYPDDFAAFLKSLTESELKLEFDQKNLARAPLRLTAGSRIICTSPVKV